MVEYRDRLALAMKNAPALASVPDRSRIQKLADALGLSYQAIKKVLDGKSSAFNAANNAKAATFLGADPNWLATGIGSGGVTYGKAPAVPTPRVMENMAMQDVFADWRLKASPISLEVIEGLSLLAEKNALREEDWQLIKTLMLRFGSP